MRNSGRILVATLVMGILLAPMVSVVKADGMPITMVEIQGTLRENRQLAYVTVDDSGETEMLELFLSVVSLEPGNEISIMIPLRTKPQSVIGQDMTEKEFRTQRSYNEILNMAERQNHGAERLAQETAESMKEIMTIQMMGALYVMVIGMGHGGGDGNYYELSDGMSMEVLAFNSTDSLKDYYDELGVPVPERVQEIIEEYGDFNVGIINAITRPPIDPDEFERIASQCPRQLEQFKDFVEDNPTLVVPEYWEYYHYNYPELEEIISSIADDELRMSFYNLIGATYGQGDLF